MLNILIDNQLKTPCHKTEGRIWTERFYLVQTNPGVRTVYTTEDLFDARKDSLRLPFPYLLIGVRCRKTRAGWILRDLFTQKEPWVSKTWDHPCIWVFGSRLPFAETDHVMAWIGSRSHNTADMHSYGKICLAGGSFFRPSAEALLEHSVQSYFLNGAMANHITFALRRNSRLVAQTSMKDLMSLTAWVWDLPWISRASMINRLNLLGGK